MRQIWITKTGRPETLAVRQAPDPEPQAGEVRIRVEASGVNFADIMGRMGLYPDCPPIPVVVGYEVGGRVDAVGLGADPDCVGRDVFAVTHFGGYSDVVVRALNRLAAVRKMANYFAWLMNVVASATQNHIQPVYGVGRESTLKENIVASLPGYRGMGPVRTGNQAYEHLQNDAYGNIILGVA
jgi:hypothetical protein